MKKLMYSGAGLLAIALAFVAFNLLSGQTITHARLDLTEQQLYSMSDGSRRIIDGLGEPVDLTLYFSDNAAKDLAPLRNYARRVEELLRAYEREADGKIRLHIVDPEPFSEEEDQAAENGLQGVPLNQGGDQLYFGLVGSSGADNQQVIPFFSPDQEEFLEYDISRLLQGLSKPVHPVVGLLSALPLNGGFDPLTRQPASAWMVLEEIRQQFQVESLKAGIDQIPEQVSVLMLVHPKGLPDATLYAIDQFVLRGGKLLVFVDPLSEADHSQPMLPGEPALRDSDLQPLFKAWGIRLLPEQVLADGSYALSVNAGAQQAPVRHPGWVSLPHTALDQGDVVTAGLETLTLATAGILEPLPDASTTFVPLLQSSTYAMPLTVERFENLANPEVLFRELKPTGERYTLAARLSGPAKTAYPQGIEGIKDGLQSADSINVIVVADTDLLSDRMWVQVQDFFGQRIPQPWADNATFTINALDNLSGSDALISVRSRGRFTRPFEVVTALQREAESSFRQKEEELQNRLAETDQKLAELQTNDDPQKTLELTPEQQATVQQFMQEKVKLRKELRDVRFQLNADIESLGRTLKLLNIVLVPAVLTLLVLALWWWRRRKH
jgi:ABC-type uncharacterized transport system involved in gliding motility auxiliary subunit